MKKLMIFCLAALLQTHDANALLLCEISQSPSSCSDYTATYGVNYNTVSGCSGGSTVTEFEVYGGCGPNVYSGNHGAIETPSGIQLATNAAGQYCYCQLKSINGGADLPGSPWRVFGYNHGEAAICADHCASYCAYDAHRDSVFRSALFAAAGY
jgi:hypothetical protein